MVSIYKHDSQSGKEAKPEILFFIDATKFILDIRVAQEKNNTNFVIVSVVIWLVSNLQTSQQTLIFL